MSKCDMVLSRKVSSSSCRSSFKNSPGFPVPALETTRPMSRSSVAEASCPMKSAAGAINSPKLLMLSGVGEAKALRSLGIDVVQNLPGVGENLQDHVLLSGVVFKYKGKMPDRPADSNAVEAEAYLSSGPSCDTDISLIPHQLPVVTPEVATRFGAPPPDAFTIAPALVQP